MTSNIIAVPLARAVGKTGLESPDKSVRVYCEREPVWTKDWTRTDQTMATRYIVWRAKARGVRDDSIKVEISRKTIGKIKQEWGLLRKSNPSLAEWIIKNKVPELEGVYSLTRRSRPE